MLTIDELHDVLKLAHLISPIVPGVQMPYSHAKTWHTVLTERLPGDTYEPLTADECRVAVIEHYRRSDRPLRPNSLFSRVMARRDKTTTPSTDATD